MKADNNTYFEANKALWDAKTKVHAQSNFYNLEAFLKGGTVLKEIELEELDQLEGKSLLHLQCHFGLDTLSLARLGAKVTGVDLSTESIKTARELAQKTGIEARFIESNVLELPEVLNEKFDYIFTTYGTICWLPDLDAWASIIHRFLKPGGTFYHADFHPIIDTFSLDYTELGALSYFTPPQPYMDVPEGTYANTESQINLKEYFWNHSLGELMTALLGQGLLLQSFKEYDYSPYNCFPNLEETEPNRWRFKNFGDRLPYVYSMKMRKEKE